MAARSAGTEVAEPETAREVRLSRFFQAPPELVWEALTDPKHLSQWWGPRGFVDATERIDVRPGGVWLHVMTGPDGVHYPNKTVYTEVVPPRKLAYRNSGAREHGPGARFDASITLEPEKGGTRVDLRMLFATSAERDRVVKEFGAIEGGRQTLEKLSEYLPKMAGDERDFVLTRTFAAPCARVFEAWTDRAQLARWWGPHGYTNPSVDADVRPGGRYRIVMRSPEGADNTITGEFVEVVPPERLVLTMDVGTDPPEFRRLLDAARAEADRGRPFRMLTTVTFEETDGRTLLTLRQRFETAVDRDADVKLGAEEGWGQSFDKLAALLGGDAGGGTR